MHAFNLLKVLQRVRGLKFYDFQDSKLKSLSDDIQFSVSPSKKPVGLEETIQYLAKRLEVMRYNIREIVSELPAKDTLRVL